METTDIIKPENLVYKKPALLKDVAMHYCPGCSHSTVHKIICEVIEEMGAEEYLSKLEYYEKVENIAEKQKEMSESNMAWNNELNAASKMPDFESDQGWETIKIPGIIVCSLSY